MVNGECLAAVYRIVVHIAKESDRRIFKPCFFVHIVYISLHILWVDQPSSTSEFEGPFS